MRPTLIVIAGPTGIGKTALSIAVASHYKTSIISADSRQCYQEMSIGTAKPDAHELLSVPHYFIDSHSVHESINASDYETLALGYLKEIFQYHSIAVVCGGTGLYIKALLEGIDDMPSVDPEVEQMVKDGFDQGGIAWLQEELQSKDPEFLNQSEQQNPVRLIRALAFFETHQESILKYRSGTAKKREFDVIKIALDMDREALYQRINQRVEHMLAQGLLDEVERLYPLRALKNLQTVGYSEFYETGTWPLNPAVLAQAIDKVKQHSRNYAKRQLTWFRKDKEYQWFAPDDHTGVINYLKSQLA